MYEVIHPSIKTLACNRALTCMRCSSLPDCTPKQAQGIVHARLGSETQGKHGTLACMRCSSLPDCTPKQYSWPSSPRQNIQSPRGDTQAATKSPPSRFPDWNDFTTCSAPARMGITAHLG